MGVTTGIHSLVTIRATLMSHEVPQPDHVYRNPARYGRLLPMRSPARELYMKRILIIEDDRDIVELVRYNLANEGFQVAAAFDGNSGLATLKKTPPDLSASGPDAAENVRVWKSAGKSARKNP